MIDSKNKITKKENLILIIVFIILWFIIFFPVIFLGKEKKTETVIDIKLLNSLSEDKIIKTTNFIKDSELQNYNEFIKNKLINKYPDSFVDLLLNSEQTYNFNDSYLKILYNQNNVLESTRIFSLTIPYEEINNMITFEYDNTIKSINIETEDKPSMIVSITYDDGPNGQRTNKLLEMLDDYNYNSTFFLVGNKMESDNNTVKNIYNSSSEVAYHSYAHKYLTKQKSEEITSEYNLSNEIFNKITGGTLNLTRPPYGSYNERVMQALPTPFIRWNLDTNDWKYKDPIELANYVNDNIKDGDIVLFHDSYDSSIEASRLLFEKLYLRNIQVVSITNLAKEKGITLENNKAYYSFN